MTEPTISGHDLRHRLDEAHDLWVVHGPGPKDLRHGHLPGAVALPVERLFAVLTPDDEVVVYGRDAGCRASRELVQRLRREGLTRVRWYRGGLADWVAHGGAIEAEGGRDRGTSTGPEDEPPGS
jgi:rhodanese-related sulfurtransferase